jgi:hypothetical protein
MRKEKRKRDNKINSLIGIPFIFTIVLLGLYLSYYKPQYEKDPLGEVIYHSERYKQSSTDNWHLIDFNYFSIETPNDYFYFLEDGIHGGKIGGLTNLKDTLNFVFGRYYFDACDGIVIGEVIGKCDTLRVYKNRNNETIFVRTEHNYCAFIKRDERENLFKMWADLSYDRQLIEKIFESIRTK